MRHSASLACRLLVACAAAAPASTWSQVTTYDPVTKLVTIPTVAVGAATFSNVTLLDTGNYVFTLQGATAQVPPGPGVASYDAATGVLTLPAVKVGGTTFLDVTLKDIGNYTFTLQGATEWPAASQAEVLAFFAQVDAMFATGVPATGAARFALTDGCWREDGRTRANGIADWDADSADNPRRYAYQVGRVTRNVQVLAVRTRVNADGSTRTEIDTQVDVGYADGTGTTEAFVPLIRGSSSGTPGCTTPQDAATLRSLGNQQLVGTAVRARNTREQRHALASGAALSPAVTYRRSVQWSIVDPMGNASHVIVTGPGPAATVNGVATQFSLKFISPRLLASAPELQGKPGNFLNWLDDDGFRWCRAATDPAVAAIADCTGRGATSFDYGVTTSAPGPSADANFAAQGWLAGGVYRFDVYNDDGWKTPDGHVGRTPLATYYDTLKALPLGFAEMAGSGPGADHFARMRFGAMTMAQVAANASRAAPAPMNVLWTVPTVPALTNPLGLLQGWEFHQGPKLNNSGGAFNPAYRNIFYNYPGSTATSNPSWAVTPKLADQASKTYTEFTLLYSDRQDRQVISIVSFQ